MGMIITVSSGLLILAASTVLVALFVDYTAESAFVLAIIAVAYIIGKACLGL